MMRYLHTRAAVSTLEHRMEQAGVEEATLMDRAGSRLAREADDMAPRGRIVVLVGPGNNGGDGWVAARYLHAARRDVIVVCATQPGVGEGLAKDVARSALDSGVTFQVDDGAFDGLTGALERAALVIDAMFGAGFHGELREPYRAWAAQVGDADVEVLACDLPSGMEADTPDCAADTLAANRTMATIAVKVGMVIGPKAWHCGSIVVDDLGCEATLPGALAQEALCEELDAAWYRDALPIPAWDANKYSRGHALIIAGSHAYPGAAILSTLAAARSGAGFVTALVPDIIANLVRTQVIAAPVKGGASADGAFSERAALDALELAESCDSVTMGPGLTVGAGCSALVKTVVEGCTKPLLLDADAVNVVARDDTALIHRGEADLASVMTPHAGERRRLLASLGMEVRPAEHADLVERIEHDRELVARFGCVLVDKGATTLVVSRERVVLYADGPSALATSGTGDVLSGIIGSLLACGLPPADAAALGVYLHGCAANVAVRTRTMMCMTAQDLIECIPVAVKELIDTEDCNV